jgi:hypothetical protein
MQNLYWTIYLRKFRREEKKQQISFKLNRKCVLKIKKFLIVFKFILIEMIDEKQKGSQSARQDYF